MFGKICAKFVARKWTGFRSEPKAEADKQQNIYQRKNSLEISGKVVLAEFQVTKVS